MARTADGGMEFFQRHPQRITNKGFVYYQNLIEYNPLLFQMASEKLNETQDNFFSEHNLEDTIYTIEQTATKEFAKEKALLFDRLGVELFDQLDAPTIKELTEAINDLMQTKEIYERNMHRILGDEGQNNQQAKIDISSFFFDYFQEEWAKEFDRNSNEVRDVIELIPLVANEEATEDTLKRAIERLGRKVFDAAIERMIFSAETNKTEDQDKLAYSELYDSIDKLRHDGIYGEQIAEAMGFDKFIKEMQKVLTQSAPAKDKKAREAQAKKALGGASAISTKTGSIAEAWAAAVTNELSKLTTANYDNIKLNVRKVGQMSAKPDLMATVGINIEPILNTLDKFKGEDSGRISRGKFLRAYNEVKRELDKRKGGFVIFTNAKNYTLQKKEGESGYLFSKNGFSAGASGNLDDLKYIYKRAENLSSDGGSMGEQLATLIANTAKGAMLEGNKKKYENFLAKDIAYFLFDDVKMIGDDPENGVKAIHLLYLDGVYISLSAFLFIFLSALKEAAQAINFSPSSVVKVTYNPGKILFPNGGEAGPKTWTSKDWYAQREHSRTKTTFDVHFMASFVKILSTFLKN